MTKRILSFELALVLYIQLHVCTVELLSRVSQSPLAAPYMAKYRSTNSLDCRYVPRFLRCRYLRQWRHDAHLAYAIPSTKQCSHCLKTHNRYCWLFSCETWRDMIECLHPITAIYDFGMVGECCLNCLDLLYLPNWEYVAKVLMHWDNQAYHS
jgi:hypothetical protein